MKLHILVLTSTYPRWRGDTIPAFVHALSSRLTAQFDVTVLAPHCAGAAINETIDGVRVVRFRYAPERWEVLAYGSGMIDQTRKHPWLRLLLPWMYLKFFFSAWRVHLKHRVNAVHAHWILPQGIVAVLLRAAAGTPFVVTCHGADVTALRGAMANSLRRWVARAATVVAPVSQHLLNVIRDQQVKPEKLVCAPMGVDVEHAFAWHETPPHARNGFVFVGRLVPKKGLMTLLQAFSQLPQHQRAEGLIVIGDGPDRHAAEQLAAQLGIAAQVSFLGSIENSAVAPYLRRARALVAPFEVAPNGDQEGLGLVVVEAMAIGTPVITTTMPATRDAAIAGETALVCPMGDSAEIANAMQRVCNEPQMATAMALRARQHVISRFSWESVAQRYGDLLEKVAMTNALRSL